MATPIALLNLVHGKWRTWVSTSGVALAIVLIFMQWGFLGAVAATAVRIYDRLEFDVLLRSPDYFHFCDAREIPRESLFQVASMPDVQWTRPLHVTLATWRIPATPHTIHGRTAGELRAILAVAMEPAQNVFRLAEIQDQAHRLTRAGTVLIDRKSKGDDYGAWDNTSFGSEDVGREVEIGDKRFQIAGHFSLGTGLAANGSVLMSGADFARIYPGDALNRVQFGLVKLKPGVRADQFRARAQQRLAGLASADAEPERLDSPVTVLTREDARRLEVRHWLWGTPIGAIFMIGVAVALVVGSVVVYMVLSNDVANHVREYATLKAMGYSHGYLSGVVMRQALIMALLGYAVAWCCAELLYRLVGSLANIPMEMTWTIRGLVLALSIGMCCVSGLATLRKLRKADPADLF